MSVLPVAITGANIQVSCDNGHSSSVPIASLAPAVAGGFGVLSLTCSTCGEGSSHPISGGADQAGVQALFLALATAKGCPCGALAAGKPAALVRSHLRQHAQALGAGFVA